MPAAAPDSKVRADIQALRGLAVLSVVLFHVGVGPFAAGYLGVDIFFVISGFLITSLVAAGIERGDFSLAGFYFRRAKRLLPAAYTTVAITVLVAPWCLSRRELHDLAWQAAGAVTFTANVVLWRQTGYFDGAAELKPLLHTWSLSLEEQYYLLLPAALLLLARRRWLGFTLGALVISAGLCAAGVIHKPVLAFYLLPTRAWELLVGSAGALWLRQRPPGADGGATPLVRALFFPALVGLLALPVWPLPGPHPGLGAALACAATLIVLLRRHPGLERSAPVRGLAAVGDLSYSLYLVHWPILALLRNAWGNPAEVLPLGWRLGALLASPVAAWALYRWVEAPIHHARWRASPARVGGLVLASLSLVGLTPLLMRATQGPVDYEALRAATDGFAPACDYDRHRIHAQGRMPQPQAREAAGVGRFVRHASRARAGRRPQCRRPDPGHDEHLRAAARPGAHQAGRGRAEHAVRRRLGPALHRLQRLGAGLAARQPRGAGGGAFQPAHGLHRWRRLAPAHARRPRRAGAARVPPAHAAGAAAHGSGRPRRGQAGGADGAAAAGRVRCRRLPRAAAERPAGTGATRPVRDRRRGLPKAARRGAGPAGRRRAPGGAGDPPRPLAVRPAGLQDLGRPHAGLSRLRAPHQRRVQAA
ncbi:MAG: acyltransferase [Betaproteobacteria bacterium]|nr:acyltransferase [Betaproteobacteria bacterium]